MGVEPEGRNGRALPGYFSFSTCTDAESLELSRARSCRKRFERFSLRCIHRRAASSRWEVMRLPDLTHGFLVSFAKLGAIAPVLIPLDTYGERFCRELLIGYLGLRS
jgi:hypothetical protein